MKVIITTKYGYAEVLKLNKMDKPTAKSNEILIKSYASSVTKADTMMRTGNPYVGRLFLGLTRPKHQDWATGLAGVVESAGAEATRFNMRDKVFSENIYSFGTNAEYVIVSDDGIVAHMPSKLSLKGPQEWADASGMEWPQPPLAQMGQMGKGLVQVRVCSLAQATVKGNSRLFGNLLPKCCHYLYIIN